MKKIYLTVMFFAIVGLLSAQQAQKIESAIQKTEVSNISQAELQVKAKMQMKSFLNRSNNSKDVKSRWYNSAFAIESLQGSSVASANNIFPDTTILVNYSTGYSGPWIHSIGECIDPLSDYFLSANELKINKYMPYTVDSVGFYFIYDRTSDASIVDTLLIQLRSASTDYMYADAANYSWVDNYNTDTLAVRIIPYDLGKYYSTDAEVTTIKVPLTEAVYGDTLENGFNYMTVAPGSIVNIPAGEQAIATFGFIPGYTWNANVDTLITKNRLRFISYEENTGSYPTYFKWDWTSSYILTTDDLTADPVTSYSSALLFSEDYSYEHHWVELLLTANETAISNSTAGTLNVSQNRPNPFTSNTTVAYNLEKASNVNVTIYNVAGAKVMDINEGMQSVGSHNLTINASNLQAGVYFYTFTADNNSVTKKMIVY